MNACLRAYKRTSTQVRCVTGHDHALFARRRSPHDAACCRHFQGMACYCWCRASTSTSTRCSWRRVYRNYAPSVLWEKATRKVWWRAATPWRFVHTHPELHCDVSRGTQCGHWTSTSSSVPSRLRRECSSLTLPTTRPARFVRQVSCSRRRFGSRRAASCLVHAETGV